jgi:hypothetical protein
VNTHDDIPNEEERMRPVPMPYRPRLIVAFFVSLFWQGLDSVGLLDWFSLPSGPQFLFVLSTSLIASVAILYPTALFCKRQRSFRMGLLCLVGIAIAACAFVVVLAVFLLKNGMISRN